MTIRELMTGALITAEPDMPILDARQLMVTEKIRHLLVRKGKGKLLGIITDRDIRLNLPSKATSLSVWEINHLLTKLTVGRVMTGSVITAGPDRPARDAAQLMLDHKIGAVPVLDGGQLIVDHHGDGHRAGLRDDDGPTADLDVLTDAGAGS
jgi:acetoin utilization protein AcuB